MTFIIRGSENNSHFRSSPWKCFDNLLAWMRLSLFFISHDGWQWAYIRRERNAGSLARCFLAWCVLASVVLPPFTAPLQESSEVACPLCQRKEDNSHSLCYSRAKGNMRGCAGSEQASLAGVPCRGSFWPSEMREVLRSSGDLTGHCDAGLSDVQTEGMGQAHRHFQYWWRVISFLFVNI